MMATEHITNAEEHIQKTIALKSQIPKDLRAKANDFLNSRLYANNLVDIITELERTEIQYQQMNAAILTLEVIFTELLKRKEMVVTVEPLKPKVDSPHNKYREWLLERYEETTRNILACLENENMQAAQQALCTAMKLLVAESKNPLDSLEHNKFPKRRLRNILLAMLSNKTCSIPLIQRFKEYAEYLDVLSVSWKLLPQLATRETFEDELFALNYLELINTLQVTKDVHEQGKLFCSFEDAGVDMKMHYDYIKTRKTINKVWHSIMVWCDGTKESVHKQTLILLLERIMPHLDKPVLLTDFLMDSLDCGGAISLLALQGIFTLIQKHNITYPNIYEKLYSMFEPEIFHTKFKARLFYLADIFLTSTHLPESLVGAFVKRLARLSLIAPPQDAVIILYFIGNLILRHTGLKRLICAQAPTEVNSDPFIMEEREPSKSNALESSLWEIVLLQKHAIPSVANAARFISQPLPTREWDLSAVLEIKEDDMFDQEISRKSKQYALAFERPNAVYLARNDKFSKYWQLY